MGFNIFILMSHQNNPHIPILAFRLNIKKLSTTEALHDYQNITQRQYDGTQNQLRTKKAINAEKSRYAHKWSRATYITSLTLVDQKCKIFEVPIFYLGYILMHI